MEGKVEYRFLVPEEFELLRPVFEEAGGRLPAPAQAAIYAAIRNNLIVGFHTVQLVPHAEPIWIAPEERGRVSWRRLQEGVESLFDTGGTYFAFSDNPRMEKLCYKAGMHKVPLQVWAKEIK
jgi:hypothetical protein